MEMLVTPFLIGSFSLVSGILLLRFTKSRGDGGDRAKAWLAVLNGAFFLGLAMLLLVGHLFNTD